MHPLESFTIKFNRAQEHANQLNRLVREHRYSIAREGDFEADPTDDVDFRFITGADVPEVPHPWLAIMGDAIHNYRAALDHLMWGLTEFERGLTGSWTQFPILEAEAWDAGDNWRARKSLWQLSAPRQTIVKDLQPYNGWDGEGEHPLLRLHKLDIIDKHRHFNTVLHLPITTQFQVQETRDCEAFGLDAVGLGKRLEPNTEIATWKCQVTGPHPYIRVEAQFAAEIEFEDGVDVFATLALIPGYFRTDVARLFPDDMKMTFTSSAA